MMSSKPMELIRSQSKSESCMRILKKTPTIATLFSKIVEQFCQKFENTVSFCPSKT